MEEKIKQAFAQNLKNLIGEMSITEFAKKVNIPQQTISRYLLCQREITLTNLYKIADFFDEFSCIATNLPKSTCLFHSYLLK